MNDITLSHDQSAPWIPTTALRAMAAAAWMSILLGVLVESLVLATRAAAGTAPQMAQTVAELAGSVTWAVVVCTGISLGSAASRHRQRMMGLLGFLCAPLAWALAKGVQHGTLAMLDMHGEKFGLAVLQVGALKTAEYTLLAIAVARLTQTRHATLLQHFLVGLGLGIVFGAAIVGVNLWHAPNHALPEARLLGLTVNEVIFPIGCVAVLYFIARLNDRAEAGAARS
jgi:hypothetical protein